ncbi:coiled-coil domain-containing protein 142 isoform X2 [Zootoca vivipara]|uniref:coiled-coil domain-containing protein 142 isoform X2 n=1 Tax=Zootoca vivipara TaxID=8524 RepID=UPI00293C0123|nr:coiled-coil domain-containing protein 142 isoform X2 [Zootoca vivipara]
MSAATPELFATGLNCRGSFTFTHFGSHQPQWPGSAYVVGMAGKSLHLATLRAGCCTRWAPFGLILWLSSEGLRTHSGRFSEPKSGSKWQPVKGLCSEKAPLAAPGHGGSDSPSVAGPGLWLEEALPKVGGIRVQWGCLSFEAGVGAVSVLTLLFFPQVIGAETVGLNAIFLLLMSRVSQASGGILPPLSSLVGPRKVLPADGGEPLEAADTASRSLTPLAKSFQKAEALLRHCVNPSLWRLLPPRTSESAYDSEEEDSPGGLARLAQVERSFLGLSRCLCVMENPRTETFQAHVRPALPDTPRGAFTYHAARSSVARQGATLHALLQHRHRLRLSRHYTRRLKAASGFVQHLMAAERCLPTLQPLAGQPNATWGRQLRGLCEELRTHATHWEGLQRRIRSDPWLRHMLLQRHEVVQHMRRSLCLLALHAVCLLDRHIEALLRSLAHALPVPAAPLSDFFQGLEIYNQVVNDPALQQAFLEQPGLRRTASSSPAFPLERILGILAAERGKRAAQRLHPLLLRVGGLEPAPWGGDAKPGLLERASQASPSGEGLPSLSVELQALCHEEEEGLLVVLGELVASTDSLWHHVLNRPKQEKPLECLEPTDLPPGLDSASLPSWKSVRWLDTSFREAAAALYAQYCPLLWRAASSSLAHRLELHPPLAHFQLGAAAALARRLSHGLAQACVPQESKEELKDLVLQLLTRDVLQHWDQGFCQALGSSLTDKCLAKPAQSTEVACSRTAQLLQGLYLPLAFSLQCLDSQLTESTAGNLVPSGLHLRLLSLSLATAHSSCYWVMSKAYQYLASWSLNQFLLVTQGDLQLLKAESSRMSTLVSTAFPEGRRKQSPLLSGQEQELSQQIHSTASSVQLFANKVLTLFSSDCKRMAAEIFSQTMPLGKHWRLALRTELPPSPSEYASAAAQSVLGQVLLGIQLLPQDAQGPALSQVTTAFLEAWMDHILAQKIKFSLQGALQLKQDFDLVRELLQSEDYGLSPQIKELVLSLRVFQQVDNAIACLLQQPPKTSLPSPTWDAFHKCCSHDGIRTQDGGPGSLNSLESLEGLPTQARAALESQAGDLLSRMQGGGCSPETYLSPMQQEWLALRLHGGRRWKVPALPCMNRTSEP